MSESINNNIYIQDESKSINNNVHIQNENETFSDISDLIIRFKKLVIDDTTNTNTDNSSIIISDNTHSSNHQNDTTPEFCLDNSFPKKSDVSNDKNDMSNKIAGCGVKTRDIKYPISVDDAYMNELNIRKQQDMVFSVVNNPKLPDFEKHKIYTNIINEANAYSDDYITYITKQIYSGPIDLQGVFVNCSSDIHHNSSKNNKYTIIFGNDNHNNDFSECINNTEVTIGMLRHTQGEKWLNGLIAYNNNSIVVRDDDNNFGMPGFMKCVNFYNRLGVKIMKDYIVPHLIDYVNCHMINTYKNYSYVRSIICELYSKVLDEKMSIINEAIKNGQSITENQLFYDLLTKTNVNSIHSNSNFNSSLKEVIISDNDDKNNRIYQLEQKVLELENIINKALDKMTYLEEICLDISIKDHHKIFDNNRE